MTITHNGVLNMHCPVCGSNRDPKLEKCPTCGINYAKWLSKTVDRLTSRTLKVMKTAKLPKKDEKTSPAPKRYKEIIKQEP